MNTGTVKWFNSKKGYGFIQPDQGENDVFVHMQAVIRSNMTTLLNNQRVSYELSTNKEGRVSAINLRVIED